MKTSRWERRKDEEEKRGEQKSDRTSRKKWSTREMEA